MKKQAAATHNSAFCVSCVSFLASQRTVGVFAVGVATGSTAATAALWSCGRAMGSKLLGYHQAQCMRCLKTPIALCVHNAPWWTRVFFGGLFDNGWKVHGYHIVGWFALARLLSVCFCVCVFGRSLEHPECVWLQNTGPKRI